MSWQIRKDADVIIDEIELYICVIKDFMVTSIKKKSGNMNIV